MAQTKDPDDLAAIILPGVLQGFKKAPPPAYNGPLDAQALSDLVDGEVPPAFLTGVKAFARTWVNKHGDVVIALLYRLESVSLAGEVYGELASSHREAGARTATLRELPRAYSFIGSDGMFGVVQHRGRYASLIGIISERDAYRIADAIELSRLQAARFPEERAAQAPATEGEASTNDLAAKVLSVAIFALLVWALFVVRARRKRREQLHPEIPFGAEWIQNTERRSRVVVVMLAIAGVVSLAATFSSLAQANLVRRVQDGQGITFAEAQANDSRQNAIGTLELGMFLVTGIAWLMWQHRAHQNLERVSAVGEVRFTPGWAVGWWFVPFANLVMPYKTMRELADISTRQEDPQERRSLIRKIAIWWCLFAISAVISRIAMVGFDGETLDGALRRSNMGMTIGLMRAVAAVLAIMIVLAIQRNQRMSAEPAIASAGTGSPPPPPLPIMPPLVPVAAAMVSHEIEAVEPEPVAKPATATKPRRAPAKKADGATKPRARTPRRKKSDASAAPSAPR
ncbi:MAG: DUF4328 domain-containing protein [Actinomycetota bacterium]